SRRRRACRSASEPAIGPTSTVGNMLRKAVRPSSDLLPVSWYTTYGTVVFCTQVPMLEIRALDQKSAKSR
ncbi:MAG: hypothetical protein QOD30_669, partial [Actinomycetota bacterium]|nr:hypothetical protein [Actinomycetota bacterium]